MVAEHQDSEEEERKYFLDAAIEESEGMEESSLTNDIGKTYVGTVLKKFSKNAKTPYMTAIGKKLFGGKYEVENVEDRIENEKAYREEVKKAGLYTPDIIGEHEEYMEFERIDGTSLREYVSNADEEETRRIGEYIDEALRTLHDDNYAITDFRISNIIVQEDGTLASVDHEYATDHATNAEKTLDVMTLISSARQLDPDVYQSFRDGFDGYQEHIDEKADIISAFSAPGHAALMEHDTHRAVNAVKNFDGLKKAYKTLGERLHNLVHSEDETSHTDTIAESRSAEND